MTAPNVNPRPIRTAENLAGSGRFDDLHTGEMVERPKVYMPWLTIAALGVIWAALGLSVVAGAW